MTREALLFGKSRIEGERILDRLIYLFREHPEYFAARRGQEIGEALDKITGLVVESIEERNALHYGGREEGD